MAIDPFKIGGEQNRQTGYLATGLVLLKDTRNFVRFDHTFKRDAEGDPRHFISFIQVQNAAHTDGSLEVDELKLDPQKPWQLHLRRKGNRLYSEVSDDGRKWQPIAPQNIATLPDHLLIGVFALNTTAAPNTFQLTDLAVHSGPSTARPQTHFPNPELIAPLDPRAALPAPWGTVSDPAAATTFHVDGAGLTVNLAGIGADLHRAYNRDNAPKVLNEIEGDFVIETTIDPLPAPKGKQLAVETVWTSAALIISTTERDHIHFDFAATNSEPARRHQLVFSLNNANGENDFRDFEMTMFDSKLPVTLRIERRGNRFFGYAFQNNIQICGGRITLPVSWPTRLRAGLMIKDTTNLPFTPKFSNFKLTQGATPIADLMNLSPLPELPAETLASNWGQPIDADHAATIAVDGEALNITMNGAPTAFAGGKLNAPHTLSNVSGDFTLRVIADPLPAPTGASPQSMPNGAHRNAAGLLVMLNDQNFLRFDRAMVIRDTGVTEPNLNESLQIQGVAEYDNKADRFPRIDPGQPLWLQIQRRGAEFTSSYSTDGEHWQEMSRHSAPDWPATLHVGVVAAGSTTQGYTARLRSLAVTQDK